MSPRRRIGFELNPVICGGTERFVTSLIHHGDASRLEPLLIFYAPPCAAVEECIRGIASAVLPYREPDGTPSDLAGMLEERGLDLVVSGYHSAALGYAATRAHIPHIWRVGGHVDVVYPGATTMEKTRQLMLIGLLSREVICPSAFLASQFAGIDGTSPRVILNGIDLETFPRVAWPGTGDAWHVAMVAHLTPQKRHEDFIRAARRALDQEPGLRFSIYGTTYPIPESRTYAQHLEDLVGSLDLGGAFSLGSFGTDRLPVLEKVDCFVLPALDEGASNGILEAMALGRPVVAARSGGNPELVENGVTGLLTDPGSVDALAAAIVSLARDRARAREMGRRGRAAIESHFDMRRVAREYASLFDQVLDGNPGHT